MPDIKIFSDSEGIDFYPATVTDGVGHPFVKKNITKLLKTYNVSSLWGGTYTISTALSKLYSYLSSDTDQRIELGLSIEFIDGTGGFQKWERFSLPSTPTSENSYGFTDSSLWRRIDSDKLLELQEAVFPLSVSFSVTPTNITVGSETELTGSWTVKRKGTDYSLVGSVTSITGVGGALNSNLPNTDVSGINTISWKEKPTEHGSFQYSLTASFDGMTVTQKSTVTCNYLTYYGTETTPYDKSILLTGKSYTVNNINLTAGRCYYTYPTYYGDLSSIKDANGFEYIDSYTKSTVTLNGITYNQYVLTDKTTITGLKQIYA